MTSSYNNYHVLYVDNYYSSVAVAEYLYKKSTYFVGTIRPNRGEPAYMREQYKSLKKNESLFLYKDNTLLMAWHDKKIVKCISTYHNNDFDTIRRRKSGGLVDRPKLINDYNRYMGGIDLMDQCSNNILKERKTRRWTLKCAQYIMKIMCNNAYILYKKYTGRKMDRMNSFI